MNKIYSTLGAITLTLGITTVGWAGPCMPIAKACMQRGYYKGGNKEGKGLVENCVMPVVSKTKTLPNVTFTDDVLQKCKTTLAAKMKGN